MKFDKTYNKATGANGENVAVAFLLQKGYNILQRNWQYKHWEIDIVASKNNKLHFIEVKTRSSKHYGNPEDSIGIKKMNAMKRAAEEYLLQYSNWIHVQFDVVAITINKEAVEEIFLIEDVYF